MVLENATMVTYSSLVILHRLLRQMNERKQLLACQHTSLTTLRGALLITSRSRDMVLKWP
jgi:hypothetical protein